MNAGEVMTAIRTKYAAPEYALLVEVANGTGIGGSTRYADALALSLYPSRGIYLTGFEIKVSRSDLLSELRNPAKQEAIGIYCDYWWIVMPADIYSAKDLIPDGWGVMVVSETGRLIVKHKAVKNTERKQWSDAFVASLFRRQAERMESMVPRSSIKDEIDRAYQQGLEAGKRHRSIDDRNEIHSFQHQVRDLSEYKRKWELLGDIVGKRGGHFTDKLVVQTAQAIKVAFYLETCGVMEKLDELQSIAERMAEMVKLHQKDIEGLRGQIED